MATKLRTLFALASGALGVAATLAGCSSERSPLEEASVDRAAEGVVTAPAAAAAAQVDGYELTLAQGTSTMDSVVSALGTRTTQYDASKTPERGAVLRYRDALTFGLDYATQTYESIALNAAVTRKTTEASQVSPNLPDLGPRPAPPYTDTGLRALHQSATIAGVSAHAYGMNRSGQAWRIWYADDLPAPPDAVKDQLALLATDGSKPCTGCTSDRASDADPADTCATARFVAGKTVLRSEVQAGGASGTWTTVLDTLHAQPVRVATSTFDPPKGWQPPPAPATPATRLLHPENTHATVVTSGAGPIAAHPDVYLFFWGKTFSDPAHAPAVSQLLNAYTDFFRPQYMGALGQYGISGGGSRIGTS
jgi:hypothetical protein